MGIQMKLLKVRKFLLTFRKGKSRDTSLDVMCYTLLCTYPLLDIYKTINHSMQSYLKGNSLTTE